MIILLSAAPALLPAVKRLLNEAKRDVAVAARHQPAKPHSRSRGVREL